MLNSLEIFSKVAEQNNLSLIVDDSDHLRGSDPIGGVRMVGWAFLCYTIAYEKVTQFFYRSLLSPRKSCC